MAKVVASRPKAQRRGDRRDDHRADGGEHQHPHAALFGIERVGQPRIGGPRPPQDAEQQACSEDTTPRRVVDEQRGDLGERVDEDEIEEQLERDDGVALVSLGRFALRHGSAHGIAVFGVGDVSPNVSGALGDRDVRHEVVVGRAVPVLASVRREMDVAGAELDNGFTSRLRPTSAFGDVEGLAAIVGMPRGPCSGREVHRARR